MQQLNLRFWAALSPAPGAASSLAKAELLRKQCRRRDGWKLGKGAANSNLP
jgi:hypothetical protein